MAGTARQGMGNQNLALRATFSRDGRRKGRKYSERRASRRKPGALPEGQHST